MYNSIKDIKDNELKFVQNENETHLYIIQGAVEVQILAYFELLSAWPRARVCVCFQMILAGGCLFRPRMRLLEVLFFYDQRRKERKATTLS